MRYDILIWGPKPIPVAATHPMMMMVRMSMWEGGGQSIGYSCYRISFISADWALILQLSCRLPQCTPMQPNTDTNQCNVHCATCNAHQCLRQTKVWALQQQLQRQIQAVCDFCKLGSNYSKKFTMLFKIFPHFQHLSQKTKLVRI